MATAARLLSVLATLFATAPLLAVDARPNILLVLVDDMGYSDLGCYGGEIRTPNIDALAFDGLRFSTFYNAGRCCPTRAALLTGLHPHQTGVGKMTFDENQPGYRGFLQPNCVTIAEVLREAGYQTSMIGKWHLALTREGPEHMKFLNNQATLESFSERASYPVGRGFESHYGTIWGVMNYFDPFSLVRDQTAVREVGEDYYATDAFTDEAVKKIHQHAEQAAPFFMYLAYTAPHWPLHAREEDIARYQHTYADGWQRTREARYARQLKMGLFADADGARLSERHDKEHSWDAEPQQRWESRAMAVHAAMIDRVDQGMGKIVRALHKEGEFDNTLILFLSDNGASPERPAAPGFDRNSQTRHGEKVTYFGAGTAKDILPGGETTYAGIGPRWANVSNTPFRYWKAHQHEGGIRTPLVVHWPAGLTATPGSITHQPGHIIDVMATCLPLGKTSYPRTFRGTPITPLAGKSLLPILRGEQRTGHPTLCFEHDGHRALRQGDWKLVAKADSPWELYQLPSDQTEMHNLAAAQPDRCASLARQWQAWAEQSGVVAKKTPETRPKQKLSQR